MSLSWLVSSSSSSQPWSRCSRSGVTIPGVGAHGSAVVTVVENVGHRLGSVVRGRDRSDAEVSKTHGRARAELAAPITVNIDPRPRAVGRPHRRRAVPAQKDIEAPYVVGVLMGQEDRVDLVRRPPEGLEAAPHLEGRDADIDQDRGLARMDQHRVARGSRREDQDFHGHTPVEPKPPSPRSEAVRDSVSENDARVTGATRSCAMRSPRPMATRVGTEVDQQHLELSSVIAVDRCPVR